MFYSPKFIAIDDKESHLLGITTTFENIGSHCVGIQYSKETGLQDKNHLFKGVRIIFCDFHLIDSSISTDNSKHCTVIADLLETNILEENGPFLLIIWTEHAQVKDELKNYLDANLESAHSRPIALFTISKTNFINPATGDILDSDLLKSEILGKVFECPQIATLLSLEFDCLRAANEILLSLMALIPHEKRKFSQLPLEIDIVLSRLATIAVGKSNVEKDPRAAVAKVLTPLLEDKILNMNSEIKQLWRKAVTQEKTLPQINQKEIGRLNSNLHLAKPHNENISFKDWGAVVEIADEFLTPVYFANRFGCNLKQIFGEEFKISRDNRKDCKLILVRIGAACDYAQQKSGPVNYLLGLIVPQCVQRNIDNSEKASMAEWKSPVFYIDGETEPFNLFINTRYNFISAESDKMESWVIKYRLREQILMQLISYTSNHLSRIGIFESR